MDNQHLPEREELMAAERVSLFTVRDVGRSLANFLGLVVIYVLSVVLYELDAGWRGFLATGWLVFIYSPPFLASATTLIISREGGDIVLFHRWSAARRRHAENVAKAKNEGLNEGRDLGRTEGHTEGFAEGRSEGLNEGLNKGIDLGRDEGRDEKQQEWAAWNARRLEAAAKGEPFNEPPPQ